jgi:hypothetical protein
MFEVLTEAPGLTCRRGRSAPAVDMRNKAGPVLLDRWSAKGWLRWIYDSDITGPWRDG